MISVVLLYKCSSLLQSVSGGDSSAIHALNKHQEVSPFSWDKVWSCSDWCKQTQGRGPFESVWFTTRDKSQTAGRAVQTANKSRGELAEIQNPQSTVQQSKQSKETTEICPEKWVRTFPWVWLWHTKNTAEDCVGQTRSHFRRGVESG